MNRPVSRRALGIPLAGALLLFLLSTLGPTGSATAAPPANPADVCWNIVAAPNPSEYSELYDVSVLSTGEAWAVGVKWSAGGTRQTEILRWRGTAWQPVSSPNPSVYGNYLLSVSARTASDAWAVGYTNAADGSTDTLILHWNGSAWAVIPSPSPGDGDNHLNYVRARAANDVWAVGWTACRTCWWNTLILHWNGSAWSQVPSPSPPQTNSWLNSVAVLAANDAWAVGSAKDDYWEDEQLILHWDGTAWTRWTPPSYYPPGQLTSISAISPSDIWAVGGGYNYGMIIIHWDGTTWTSRSPAIYALPGLTGVTALSSANVWATGYARNYEFGAISLHWDGSAWTQLPMPVPPSGAETVLINMTANAAGDVWAVGYTSEHTYAYHNLILRYGPGCAVPPPAFTPTRTPWPTNTATPTPTNTPTATPTPRCPGQAYADVCPFDWFYPFVTHLTNLGAIAGYPCGGPGEPCYPPNFPPWFRPNASITRGQVAKIVTFAFGFNEPVPSAQQTFEDVPPTSTFWLFIERLAGRGAIAGYPCGGPFEPCQPPANRPYFRWGNNMTRAQLSKVIALARNWPLINPTAATFEDVAPSHPFYSYVETASAAGIVSGYPCGGPFEPCVPPANRAYFRAYNTITRAQAAKMIDLARTETPPSPTPTVTWTPTATPIPSPPTSTPTATETAPPEPATAPPTEPPQVVTKTRGR